MTALSTGSLQVGYPGKGEDKVLLDDLNLELDTGQLICLVGRNGTGKSTLIRTLSGLQQALSGEIRISGKELGALGLKEKARFLSVVLTHNTISGLMTVEEVVSLGRYPHTNWFASFSQTDRDAVRSAMELTGMMELADQYYDQLSDGQQQKVIISRAVAQDTPLIILDEPTNHLDIGNKAEILQLLKFLAHNKTKTILVSTHDLDLALQMADVLWVIADGRLYQGPPEQMLLEGILDKAFPYTGVDLFSGRVLKPASGIKAYVKGDSLYAEVTRSALRRLDFRLLKDPAGAELLVVAGQESWEVVYEGRSQDISGIAELLELLHRLRSFSTT